MLSYRFFFFKKTRVRFKSNTYEKSDRNTYENTVNKSYLHDGSLWGLTFRNKVARSACRVSSSSPLTWTYGILLFIPLYLRKIERDGLRACGTSERETKDLERRITILPKMAEEDKDIGQRWRTESDDITEEKIPWERLISLSEKFSRAGHLSTYGPTTRPIPNSFASSSFFDLFFDKSYTGSSLFQGVYLNLEISG